MNEITKIHLGRQAFIISVDAHKALKEYLRAITKHMGDSDEVVEEIELRMAELLSERGIHGKKVVLLKDIQYLKSQLGEPGDFGDGETEEERDETTTPKRLFRDRKKGVIAGVAAGLAAYFGVKPAIFRVIFVIGLLTIFGGMFKFSLTGGFWAITLLYIILWITIPEAKTSSDRLQMQGRPVTAETIKDLAERADVNGAVSRVERAISRVAVRLTKVALAVIGYGLILAGIGGLLGLMALGVYWSLNHDMIPGNIFPVGASEVLLVCLAFITAAIAALFFVITGLAVVKRKWPLQGWALGAIVAVFLIGVTVSGALAADTAPRVSQRYEASRHTYTRTVPEFRKLHVVGDHTMSDVRYEESSNYKVTAKYWGNADFSTLVTDVTDQVLTIDLAQVAESVGCKKLCIFQPEYVEIVIQGPKLEEIVSASARTQLSVPDVENQTIRVQSTGGIVDFPNFVGENVKVERADDSVWTLTFSGTREGVARPQSVSIYGRAASLGGENIDLTFKGQCGVFDERNMGGQINLYGWFKVLTVNGKQIGGPNDLRALWNVPGESPYKCLDIPRTSIDSL